MSSKFPAPKDKPAFASPALRQGFTLVEVLVASVVFTLLLMVAMSVLGQASSVWRRSADRVEAFQSARLGFDLLTRNLSQATLNTYNDYFDSNNRTLASYGDALLTRTNFMPVRYGRQSELQFVCGPAGKSSLPGTPDTGSAVFFQAPLGYSQTNTFAKLQSLLNPCGYYIQFTNNSSIPPFVNADNVYRYRLMQFLAPSEKSTVYGSVTNLNPTDYSWFLTPIRTETNSVQPIADNIIALVVRPCDPAQANTAPDALVREYAYNSRLNANINPQPITANQLPPALLVTMIAIDESSARRIAAGNTPPAAIQSALGGRFQDAGSFDSDLESVKKDLTDANIQYRVFDTVVPILETKWTKN